jgi:hypothetical protein
LCCLTPNLGFRFAFSTMAFRAITISLAVG